MNTEERILELEKRILNLEKELIETKSKLANQNVSSINSANQTTESSVIKKQPQSISKDPSVSVNPDRQILSNIPNQTNTANPVSASKKQNLETTIGKNVIGILASVLFFIAFIVFGTYVYQNLGDMGKSILLFLGSSLITGIGLLVHKKLGNTFSLSVISCGIGCFYITLIINTVYFGFLSKLALYILILVWLFCISTLSKKLESSLLCVIGQCGLYISVIFGTSSNAMSEFLWFSFFVFFMVADLLYLRICSFKKMEHLRIFFSIGTVLSCYFIALRNHELFCFYNKSGTNPVIILLYFVLMFVLVIYTFYHFYKTAKEGMLENKSLYTFLACFYFFRIFNIYEKILGMFRINFDLHDTWKDSFMLLFTLGSLLYLTIYTHKYSKPKLTNFISILNIPILLAFGVGYAIELKLDEYSLLILLVIPLLFYGFYNSKKLYQYLGLIVLFIHIWCGLKSSLLHFILTLPAFIFAFWLQKKYLSSYSRVTKVAIYALFVLYCFVPANDLCFFLESKDIVLLYVEMVYVLILAPIQIFALKSNFIKDYLDLNKTEKLTEYPVRMVNILLLFIGVGHLYDSIPSWGYFLMLIATSILCFVGVKQFLDEHSNTLWAGIYIGIKFTIYLAAIFYSTPVNHKILFSILLLCIAVIAILVGFRFLWKSLRLYGLFLTMMSVVKLTLFDIDYSSTLGTVVALMICGVLCFIINFIYNMLSKHIVAECVKPFDSTNRNP